jgi:K+-sensing histidine kinase KdpD
MFDAFMTTKEKGMGIGLPISRSIVEAHGGRLWSENNPDGGATFNVASPVSSKREVHQIRPQRSSTLSSHETSQRAALHSPGCE